MVAYAFFSQTLSEFPIERTIEKNSNYFWTSQNHCLLVVVSHITRKVERPVEKSTVRMLKHNVNVKLPRFFQR